MDTTTTTTTLSSTTSTTNGPTSEEDDDPKTISAILSHIHEAKGGKRLIHDSVVSMQQHDGSFEKGDLVVTTTRDEALLRLQEMIQQDQVQLQKQQQVHQGNNNNNNNNHKKKPWTLLWRRLQNIFIKKQSTKSREKDEQQQQQQSQYNATKKWQFASSPHEQFGKTLDDTLLAFIEWARIKQKENDDDGQIEELNAFNVSKAFRRLERYAEWMEEEREDLTCLGPLSAESIQRALNAWGTQFTIDKAGHLVWWMDLLQVDQALVQTLNEQESLRAFCWMFHFVMYHPQAQRNGLVVCKHVHHFGFDQAMSVIPMSLKTKLNKLTVASLPIQMKHIYILGSPRWMEVWMNFLFLFLSPKMKERFVFLHNLQTIHSIMGGPEYIPQAFGHLKGHLEHDLVYQTYFAALPLSS